MPASYAGVLPVVGAKCPAAAWGADEHGSASPFWSFLCGRAATKKKCAPTKNVRGTLHRSLCHLHKSRLVTTETLRYPNLSQQQIVFCFHRKIRRNQIAIPYFEKGLSFQITFNSINSQSKPFCADAYFIKKTLSATPRL